MSRLLIAFAILTGALSVRAQNASPLHGRVEDHTYVSPTGAYKVVIPVLPELGGSITDTPNVVTFQDNFTVHVSIATFQQDATQRWELETRGVKDYLVYFFKSFVVSDFQRSFKGIQIESARFNPRTMGGALIAYLLIPGGSMFTGRMPQIAVPEHPPVAKRGNMLFVKDGYIYVISTELAERVTEGSAYNKTASEEDEILRQRLDDILDKMTFLKPPKSDVIP